MQESVEGIVNHIIYRNEENGYTVFELSADGKELTCVGFFQSVNEGESMEAFGRYTEHMSYGQQFKIDRYEIKVPRSAAAIERYLGSGAVKGIGAALAARIVKKFGEDTFRIMEEEPERLAEIKGISERMAREISRQASEQRNMRRAMIFLQQYGITLNLGVRIYREYGEDMYSLLKENPYRLAEDIDGVGFRTADAIASRIGIQSDSDYRIRCGILYTLANAAGEGSVYLPESELTARASELLGVPEEAVSGQLSDLAIERKVVVREHFRKEPPGMQPESFPEKEKIIYSGRNYYLELNTARMLTELNVVCCEDDAEIQKKMERLQKKSKIILEPEQKKAVECAAKNGLFIMTGGPGTGKTTTINEMLRYFEAESMDIRLAAPTGRAAKRMTETTGYEASTIHRLLEISSAADGMGEEVRFDRNEQNPLEADVIIIDEMSMVDIFLMHALLSAIARGTRLILVGDVDQLPSVGPGAVLKDLISSEAFPCVRLTKIFRQAAFSDIVVNAHKIDQGEQISLDNKSRDFFFLRRTDANLIISNVIQLVRDKMPAYVNAKPFDIQVLSPMRKGLLGVERLNRILQEYLNPPAGNKAEKTFGDGKFRVGDKVMQIKNNYQIEWEVRGKYGIAIERGQGIFNGDMGIIREINDFAAILTIEFDEGRFVDYPFANLEELELSYAITIHKSQGSEYPAVILPLLSGPRMLMTRNLLYTAVTRAKKCVTILGSEEAVRMMIENQSEMQRYTSLDERIAELCEIKESGK